MATELLIGDGKDVSRRAPSQLGPKIGDVLRQNRLQIFRSLFSQSPKRHHEPRKVAMFRSRRIAAFHCLLHMVPLGGAITLLVLRWTQYCISSNPPNATTLQFVAKFHELLMQVSVVEIMLSIVRSEATQGFVPLGTLSGAIQSTQLSYLWSFDFLSMFTSDAFCGRGWHKAGMIVAIPILLISTALVGPSSAILMIPEPGCTIWATSGLYISEPLESFFPTRLGFENGLAL
jgi:hypothetical protein